MSGHEAELLSPVLALALIGALGVGSQWLAWRLSIPAIVLMLAAGLVAGPVTGLFDPQSLLGPMMGPAVSIAVAVILFEGGLTLNLHGLRDAASGVRRLVLVGAPLGWLLSTLALRLGAGLSWEASAVFGGILIVTGPTVIAPLLRQAKLARRPALLLQWEAIVNDPIGALAAVLAFETVLVLREAETMGHAFMTLAVGIVAATVLGLIAGRAIVFAFSTGRVPEYMKVSVLFAAVLLVFAASDQVLHESGLLAVTLMGIVIANADLPSYEELRRFKEHATVLLVSGVFILLSASIDFSELAALSWRAGLAVALIVLVARPLTVMVSLAFSDVPMKERLLVALTGPRGVVLVAVAGLFGERLTELGVEGGGIVGALAFVLVAVTVVIHGFTLAPLARRLKLTGGNVPGVLIVGSSGFTIDLAEALKRAEIPVLLSDANRWRLRSAREAGLPVFYGDILSEAAEHHVELVAFETIIAATDNDAYNTLVATDLAPEFGRENVWQVPQARAGGARHSLPATLGGKSFGGEPLAELSRRSREGWRVRITKITAEYPFAKWAEDRPEAIRLAVLGPGGRMRVIGNEEQPKIAEGSRIVALVPPDSAEKAA